MADEIDQRVDVLHAHDSTAQEWLRAAASSWKRGPQVIERDYLRMYDSKRKSSM